MIISDQWQSYQLIDAGDGEKLEQWGPYILQRPDPQAVWPHGPWPRADAVYLRSSSGGGAWQKQSAMPATWDIPYNGLPVPLTFRLELMGFKHTGLFPEQAANWSFCYERIRSAVQSGRSVRILNLFAYTGGATAAAAAAGAAEVVHLDASRGMNARARENLVLSGLSGCLVRTIQDDAQKFVERELRRGRRYDGIIMDPPAYGRGPGGELWKLEDALYSLVERSAGLLDENPLLFLLNAYASSLGPAALADILSLVLKPRFSGQVQSGELCLPARERGLVLPCGCTGRWFT